MINNFFSEKNYFRKLSIKAIVIIA